MERNGAERAQRGAVGMRRVAQAVHARRRRPRARRPGCPRSPRTRPVPRPRPRRRPGTGRAPACRGRRRGGCAAARRPMDKMPRRANLACISSCEEFDATRQGRPSADTPASASSAPATGSASRSSASTRRCISACFQPGGTGRPSRCSITGTMSVKRHAEELPVGLLRRHRPAERGQFGGDHPVADRLAVDEHPVAVEDHQPQLGAPARHQVVRAHRERTCSRGSARANGQSVCGDGQVRPPAWLQVPMPNATMRRTRVGQGGDETGIGIRGRGAEIMRAPRLRGRTPCTRCRAPPAFRYAPRRRRSAPPAPPPCRGRRARSPPRWRGRSIPAGWRATGSRWRDRGRACPDAAPRRPPCARSGTGRDRRCR